MIIDKRGKFTLKTYQSNLYTWSPDTNIDKTNKLYDKTKQKNYCTAIPYSQGEDWVSTYSYDTSFDNGVLKKIAYVECDYVS